MPPPRRLVVSCFAEGRLELARQWLAARPPGEELRVVGASTDAAAEVVREAAARVGGAFGWSRSTLATLAAETAAPELARRALVPVGRLALEAVVARVLFQQAERGGLGRFSEAWRGPGLARALAGVLQELRGAAIAPESLEEVSPELARLARACEAALAEAGLADRAQVEALAAEAAQRAAAARPLLLVDLPAPTVRQSELLAALLAPGVEACAVLPAGDAPARERFEALLGVQAEELAPEAGRGSLAALQRHLFEEGDPEPREADGAVELFSAPGESRECVEIARRIQRAAREGVRFDRMAVLLRAPEIYGPFLGEALRRAGVPAHFARGARRPDPAGRALAALLACAAEGLSARRFAEYLSLGEVPAPDAAGAPPAAAAAGDRWVPPDEELLAARTDLADESEADALDVAPQGGETIPAPRRWERLLVDAAVIGGRDRWRRRLDGLAAELEREREGLEDPDGPRAAQLERSRRDLEALCAFALPLIDALDALPASADWGEWIDALSSLASRALREPERVQSVLAELAPMAEVGPVGLREVQLVLAPRLQSAAAPPPGVRYGRVFVATPEAARGLSFERVFVPGLAEKLFPRKIGEEPILLDRQRECLDAKLATRSQRLDEERLALRLCAGAAAGALTLSYPRLDTDGARPRVPSFYGLEVLRAAEGRLPGFDELARRAEAVSEARLGWPAPDAPADAIDAAEYDLARLRGLGSTDSEVGTGAARYLLGANPHLARALRFRARRWLEGWTPADGLVKPSAAGRRALADHALSARSFSPTALQHYAGCPYRFYLYAVWKLAPREEPEAIEELDPLQRGSLVHDVQFELLGALREAELLPVTPERLEDAWAHLDAVLEKVAAHYEEDLSPAIERVWRDGVQSVRADLREWLRRASLDVSGFVPWRFELAFGLPGRLAADPASRPEPVALEGGLALRGSIDLVERRADGRVRATDHKTGKERFAAGGVVQGGKVLQPVLYALAAEQLFPTDAVESGRLYYCTSTGGFEEREVPLDEAARASARRVIETVGEALAEPFLPAAPDTGECRYCDYRPVCGPYEELRTARKWKPPLAPLAELRKLP